MAKRIELEEAQRDREWVQGFMDSPATNRGELQAAQRVLGKVIDKALTPRQREMLLMHYFDQKRVTDIARELGVSPSCVTRTLRRAETHLREIMQFFLH